ncbi:hypothetical protein B9Z19DRAFT_730790 [Tuber borchii]|uniref:Uncharacterized protein n=1 Tax=Tuber borchii TaxID=42251 RepID=A0A2T6ZYB5_TUBBO|nr:hypothetical protein B9Z19DRAFT_730790 [Tuber borchii]
MDPLISSFSVYFCPLAFSIPFLISFSAIFQLSYFSLFVGTVYRLFLISCLVRGEGWMGTVGTLLAVNWVEPGDKKGEGKGLHKSLLDLGLFYICIFFSQVIILSFFLWAFHFRCLSL